jgi:hypothetical protein
MGPTWASLSYFPHLCFFIFLSPSLSHSGSLTDSIHARKKDHSCSNHSSTNQAAQITRPHIQLLKSPRSILMLLQVRHPELTTPTMDTTTSLRSQDSAYHGRDIELRLPAMAIFFELVPPGMSAVISFRWLDFGRHGVVIVNCQCCPWLQFLNSWRPPWLRSSPVNLGHFSGLVASLIMRWACYGSTDVFEITEVGWEGCREQKIWLVDRESID